MSHTQEGGLSRRALVMAFVMMAGSFISILNQNLMTTAVPRFMDVFSVSSSMAQWLTTAFMLTNGIVIPVTSYLIRKFSSRSLYFVAMGLFGVGTIACALAPSFHLLLVGRVIQALGAGMTMPLMQTVLFVMFPPDKRGTAMGYFGLVIAFAPAIGPTISGWIIGSFPWEALFLFILPLIVIDFIAAIFVVDNVTEQTDPEFDPFSVVLSSFGFGDLLYGFGMVSSLGWTDPHIVVTLAVSLVVIVWFVIRQLRLDVPMLEMRIFSFRHFTVAMILIVLVWVSFMGSSTLLPLLMQNDLGLSPLVSGLTLMAGGVAMGIMSPITGRTFDHHGPRPLIPIGMALIACATALLALTAASGGVVCIAVGYAVLLLGISMVSMPLTTYAMNSLPMADVPHGTAMNNTIRQTVGALGTAVFVSLMEGVAAAVGGGAAGEITGTQTAFWVMCALAVVAFVISIALLHEKRPGSGEDA